MEISSIKDICTKKSSCYTICNYYICISCIYRNHNFKSLAITLSLRNNDHHAINIKLVEFIDLLDEQQKQVAAQVRTVTKPSVPFTEENSTMFPLGLNGFFLSLFTFDQVACLNDFYFF